MGQNKKNVHTQLLMTYVVRKKIVKCIAYKNTGNLIYIKYMKHIYVKSKFTWYRVHSNKTNLIRHQLQEVGCHRIGSELLKT